MREPGSTECIYEAVFEIIFLYWGGGFVAEQLIGNEVSSGNAIAQQQAYLRWR